MRKAAINLPIKGTIKTCTRRIVTLFGEQALDYLPEKFQIDLFIHYIRLELMDRMIWVEVNEGARDDLENIYMQRIPFPDGESKDAFYIEIFDFLRTTATQLVENAGVPYNSFDIWCIYKRLVKGYLFIVNEGDYRAWIFDKLQKESLGHNCLAYNDDSGIKGYDIKERYRLRPNFTIQSISSF